MRWDEFLQVHTILEIGIKLQERICTELIVDDPASFISLVAEQGYYIPEILWYERGKIGTGTKLGMGGPPDPRNPEEYFFSEVVHISREFHMDTEISEYLDYIHEVKSSYPDCDLFPSFDVAARTDI